MGTTYQSTPTNKLDDQELLHLALRASNENRHEEAINYLKQALELAPNNAKVHYMLGAEHAEIGLYDRATQEMSRAVELDPALITAQFQLGLLHFTSGRVDEAEKAWSPLNKLGENNPFYHFKKGMLSLTRDEFEDCTQALEKGISLNRANEALNNDMRRVLASFVARSQPPQTNTKHDATQVAAAPATHVLLSAYRQNRSDEKDKD
jgi:Flp pilus assembly protein TadD